MTRGIYPRATAEEKFWRHVEKTDGCWLWTGTLNYAGYGVMKTDGVQVRVHRFAYEVLIGPIPSGMEACHHCDVRHCVRPGHLFLGTTQDNTADRSAKGRSVQGERVASARLTAERVRVARRLRADGWDYIRLAALYGVGASTIRKAVARETWAHVR